MKTRLLFLAALLLLTAAVVLLFPRSELPAEPQPAETEPLILPEDYAAENDFTFRLYRTETNESGLAVTLSEDHTLSEYAGQAVAVTFWASWNAQSREQLAILAELVWNGNASAEDGALTVLPVNVGKAGKDSEKKARAALAETGADGVLPLLVDQTGVLRFNVTSTPRTVVFDAKGAVSADLAGLTGADEIIQAAAAAAEAAAAGEAVA